MKILKKATTISLLLMTLVSGATTSVYAGVCQPQTECCGPCNTV